MVGRFPTGWTGRLLVICLLAHLLLSVGTHLSTDEAHYALYAEHLALSYYDHPPLVGWLQWPAVMLGGSDLLLRIVPMVCWMLAALLLWRVTLQAVDAVLPDKSCSMADGALAILLLAFLPHLLGFGLVPDTLLLPLALAAMLQTFHLTQSAQAALPEWLLLGVILGLAGLSKYSAVFLVPGVLILLFQAHGWRWLRQRGPWCAAVLALLIISPVLIWNAQNQWASFVYQSGHAGGSQPWQWKNFLRYSLAQLLLYGVLPIWTAVAGGIWLRRNGKPEMVWLCLAFALPGLLIMLFLSGRGAALPHWTSWAWLCLLPLGGVGWHVLKSSRPRLLYGVASLQGIFSLAAMVGLLTGTPSVPFADLHGWDRAAREASRLAQDHGLPRLTVTNWSLASRFAWYARPLPLIVVEKHHDQYDRWFGRFRPGDAALWINWSIMSFAPPLRTATVSGFARCEPVGRLPAMVLGREVANFEFMKCTDWQGEN